MTERLDPFFIALFLPVYMTLAGYRTDFLELGVHEEKWRALELGAHSHGGRPSPGGDHRPGCGCTRCNVRQGVP
jgi:hypothetical protein